MKTITIAGRIGKDAELRRTQTGDPVTGFNVAVDDGFGSKKTTLWFKCSWWGKRGEALSQYLTKGAAVTVTGDLSTEFYDGKTSLTVRVNDVALQERRAEAPRELPKTSYDEESGGGSHSRELDDEIPF